MKYETCFKTIPAPSDNAVWAEYKNAYKIFVRDIGTEPTHVIIPLDKLSELKRKVGGLKHSKIRNEEPIMVKTVYGYCHGEFKSIDTYDTLYKINGHEVITSAPGGEILFAYLK